MNSESDARAMGAGIQSGAPSFDAEMRLESNREILRQRMTHDHEQSNALATLAGLADIGAPLARRYVRQHPYATLSGAALLGVWLVRGKPWRAVGSSLIAGLIVKEVIALSLSSGSRFLQQRMSAGDNPNKDREY